MAITKCNSVVTNNICEVCTLFKPAGIKLAPIVKRGAIKRSHKLTVGLSAKKLYATTAGSPYVYRNCMICTVRMGDNDMRKPCVHTKFVSTLYYLYILFCSSKKAVLVLKI